MHILYNDFKSKGFKYACLQNAWIEKRLKKYDRGGGALE